MKTLPGGTPPGIPVTRALLAGLAGGIAEVLWVTAWSAVTPLQLSVVAREITRTVYPGMAAAPMAAETGLIIHLAISMALGVAFLWVLGKYLARHYGGAGILAGSVTLLVLIWAINFLVVLPVLNPVFVTLMPFAVTLGSKALFGIAMAAVLVARPYTRPTIQKYRRADNTVVAQFGVGSGWRNKFRPTKQDVAGSNLLVPGAITDIRPGTG